MNIQIEYLHDGVQQPQYATEGSAGFDLVVDNFKTWFPDGINWESRPVDEIVTTLMLRPHGRLLVGCGFKLAIPVGFELQIRPRSGNALKAGITVLNSPGTIDSDYRGEIGIILINHSTDEVRISKGDKVAQGVLSAVPLAIFETVQTLDTTTRGEGGFGSTGYNRFNDIPRSFQSIVEKENEKLFSKEREEELIILKKDWNDSYNSGNLYSK